MRYSSNFLSISLPSNSAANLNMKGIRVFLLTLCSVYKKKRLRLVFEIQISHNYSDLIVLKCVELMIRDKNLSYSQKRSIGHVPLRENLLFYDSLYDSKQLYLSGKFNTL